MCLFEYGTLAHPASEVYTGHRHFLLTIEGGASLSTLIRVAACFRLCFLMLAPLTDSLADPRRAAIYRQRLRPDRSAHVDPDGSQHGGQEHVSAAERPSCHHGTGRRCWHMLAVGLDTLGAPVVPSFMKASIETTTSTTSFMKASIKTTASTTSILC